MPLRLPAAAPAVFRRRLFATAALPRGEHFAVPCRSNGAIKVDVYYGPSPSSPILVFLPPGPLIPETEEHEERTLKVLAAATKSTIARINYRFSPEHPWPTPLHDVLTGYDWVIENMASEHPALAKLGVCGELVGASLATSLALTECRIGEKRIVAAAVNNPIADWVFPDALPAVHAAALPEPTGTEDTSFPPDQDMLAAFKEAKTTLTKSGKPRKKRAPKKTVWERNADNATIPAARLVQRRDVLFLNPHHVFDRFASPIHFFRSPHAHFVSPQDDNLMASSLSSPEIAVDPLDLETLMDIQHFESYQNPVPESPPEEAMLTRCRAYSRNYPPATSILCLPQWHITSGAASPLLDQAAELAKMLKRSITKSSLKKKPGRAKSTSPDEKKSLEAWAETQVHVANPDGVGLWTLPDNPNWEDQVRDVGQWMAASLKEAR